MHSSLFTKTLTLCHLFCLLPHSTSDTTLADKFFCSIRVFLSTVPPDAPFVKASDTGQGSGHNKVTCSRVWTPNASKVTMGNTRDWAPDEHVGRFKNELPHGTRWQEQTTGTTERTTARPTEWMMDRLSLEFEIHAPFQMEQQDPCSISMDPCYGHHIHVPFQWIHVPWTAQSLVKSMDK